jgi:hypothetical protein
VESVNTNSNFSMERCNSDGRDDPNDMQDNNRNSSNESVVIQPVEINDAVSQHHNQTLLRGPHTSRVPPPQRRPAVRPQPERKQIPSSVEPSNVPSFRPRTDNRNNRRTLGVRVPPNRRGENRLAPSMDDLTPYFTSSGLMGYILR